MRPLVAVPVDVAHAVKKGVVTRRWQVPLVLTAAVLPMLAAGCGSSSGSSGSPSATTRTTAAATTSTTPSTSVALNTTTTVGTLPFYEVTTGNVKGLGTVLVDGQGLTLYLFVPDKQSGTSTCYGRCAEGWPPLLLPTGVTTPVAGSGIKTSLLGTTRRTDGTTQLTYNKWPLYLWVGDSQPGQATGQALDNLGGLWYVLAPDGQTITTRV